MFPWAQLSVTRAVCRFLTQADEGSAEAEDQPLEWFYADEGGADQGPFTKIQVGFQVSLGLRGALPDDS